MEIKLEKDGAQMEGREGDDKKPEGSDDFSQLSKPDAGGDLRASGLAEQGGEGGDKSGGENAAEINLAAESFSDAGRAIGETHLAEANESKAEMESQADQIRDTSQEPAADLLKE